jgi:osmotically-inducible protein OsmY
MEVNRQPLRWSSWKPGKTVVLFMAGLFIFGSIGFFCVSCGGGKAPQPPAKATEPAATPESAEQQPTPAPPKVKPEAERAAAAAAREEAERKQAVQALQAYEPSTITGSGELAARVVEALRKNPRLARGVKVQVNSRPGTVTIKGSTKTLMQRLIITETFEKIPGVSNFQAQVYISPGPIKADQLQKEVTKALSVLPGFSDPKRVQIRVKDGDVTLEGVAHAQEDVEAATNILMDIPGVVHVENKLAVSEGKWQGNDAELLRQLNAELKTIPGLDLSHLRVKVDYGQAVVSGDLPSLKLFYLVRLAAVRATSREPNTDNLTVSSESHPPNWPGRPTDPEIMAGIAAALQKVPGLDAGRIRYHVEDGTVRVSGQLQSMATAEACKAAIAGVDGVDMIIDDLDIYEHLEK